MNTRQVLKKELAWYKKHRQELPRLIDCSRIYGDKDYTAEDIIWTDKKIAELEKEIETLKPIQP